MKKLILLLFIPLVFACDSTMTNAELADVVEESIIETFKEKPEFENIEVVDLVVMKLEEKVYNGQLTIKEPDSDKKKRYQVIISFDGETFSWRINNIRFENLLD